MKKSQKNPVRKRDSANDTTNVHLNTYFANTETVFR